MISSGLEANVDGWEEWPAQQHLGWLESHVHSPTITNLKMSAESTELVSLRLIRLTTLHCTDATSHSDFVLSVLAVC